MRYLLIITIVGVLGVFGYHLYGVNAERVELKKEYTAVLEEYGELKLNTEKLQDRLEYFSNPRNLEKELRARFNYRLPNEKTIIVVPEEQNNKTTD